MLDKITAILADYGDIDTSTVTEQTAFADLGLDSLDIVELVMKIEEDFNVAIEVNDSLQTVGDIIALIQAQAQ